MLRLGSHLPDHTRSAGWHHGDVLWGMYANMIFDPRRNIRLWEDTRGALCGFAWLDEAGWLAICSDPCTGRAEDIALAMLAWAAERGREQALEAGTEVRAPDVQALESDGALARLLARCDYAAWGAPSCWRGCAGSPPGAHARPSSTPMRGTPPREHSTPPLVSASTIAFLPTPANRSASARRRWHQTRSARIMTSTQPLAGGFSVRHPAWDDLPAALALTIICANALADPGAICAAGEASMACRHRRAHVRARPGRAAHLHGERRGLRGPLWSCTRQLRGLGRAAAGRKRFRPWPLVPGRGGRDDRRHRALPRHEGGRGHGGDARRAARLARLRTGQGAAASCLRRVPSPRQACRAAVRGLAEPDRGDA